MRVALFQPDIPQNTGAIIRLTACFGVPLDIIEPCGFILSDAKLRRSSMDYLNLADIKRHISWEAFVKERKQSRLVLITTKADRSLNRFAFDDNDTLILGQESSGVPQVVHNAIPEKVKIPMNKRVRSLNVSIAAGIILWEALRQTNNLS
tara:strand:- start:67 stop:516 length:450 start_codon:yes stop_codon:yes gene_type:complete